MFASIFDSENERTFIINNIVSVAVASGEAEITYVNNKTGKIEVRRYASDKYVIRFQHT